MTINGGTEHNDFGKSVCADCYLYVNANVSFVMGVVGVQYEASGEGIAVCFQCDFASFVELPDIDSCPCFESCLFFVCHRKSFERLIARPNTTLRF